MLGGKGPRPLRSSVSTWGLEGLSLREYAQLSIGYVLLQCATSLSIEPARVGASGLVEHPDLPEGDFLPSI